MTLTRAQTITADQALEQLGNLRAAASQLANASYDRGKSLPDLVSDPPHYEQVRKVDEAARHAYDEQHRRLERLVLDLIHHRDTAPTN